MPATDSPPVLVARFLQANHYSETLEAFIKEAGLKPDAGTTKPGDWTIEKILEEKKQYDTSLNFEKRTNEGGHGWSSPAPKHPQEPQGLSNTSNILCVNAQKTTHNILVTGADRTCHFLSSNSPYQLQRTERALHDSPILCIRPIKNDYIMSSAMSGAVTLHHAPTGRVIDQRRDHAKYVVQICSYTVEDQIYVATAGWDQKVHIYLLSSQDLISEPNDCTRFGTPIHIITLPSNPESLVFTTHPDTGVLHLIVSRRDSTHLYYYSMHKLIEGINPFVLEAGRQNLAPHSNAWVSFTPSSLTTCPTDPTLLAIATSHLPHMKLIVVRLIFPGSSSTADVDGQIPPRHSTQAAAARADLALQDREFAAIILHVSTMAPQTPYSTPQVVWRPDGSGVWVNGDDGVVRGVDSKSGRVVQLLKGHEVGTKVRTLWAGYLPDIDTAGEQEVLISGGFDKKVLVWEVENSAVD